MPYSETKKALLLAEIFSIGFMMDRIELRLRVEYCCVPIWGDQKGNVDPYKLPISKELADDLIEWAHIYDATLDQNYPPDSHFASSEEKKTFIEKGHELKKRLQEELGNGYTIRYVVSDLPSPEEIS